MIPQGFKLSPRQFQVYSLLYSGYTYSQISNKLGISRSRLFKILQLVQRRLCLSSIESSLNLLQNSDYLAFNPVRIYLSVWRSSLRSRQYGFSFNFQFRF